MSRTPPVGKDAAFNLALLIIADQLGAADGQVRPDHAWEIRLQRLMDVTPLAATALKALQPLADFADFSIEWDILRTVVQRQENLWRKQDKLGKLGLALDFMRFALAIYVYTLDDPGIYTVINRVMFDPARGVKGAAPGKDLSPGLRACAPYIKLLDEALARLPAAFVFRGRVQRGVKWVYPDPEAHDPEGHFTMGTKLIMVRVRELEPGDRSDEHAEGRWHLKPFASLTGAPPSLLHPLHAVPHRN